MSRTIILIPISAGVGLTSVSLGLINALEQKRRKSRFHETYFPAEYR